MFADVYGQIRQCRQLLVVQICCWLFGYVVFCDVVLKRFLHSDVSVKCVQAYLSGKRVLFGLVIFNYWKTFAFLFASFLSKVFMEIDIWLIKIFRRNQGLIFLASISGKRLHVALINSYKISVLVYFCIDFTCADRK